jgi:hypothetical protein
VRAPAGSRAASSAWSWCLRGSGLLLLPRPHQRACGLSGPVERATHVVPHEREPADSLRRLVQVRREILSGPGQLPPRLGETQDQVVQHPGQSDGGQDQPDGKQVGDDLADGAPGGAGVGAHAGIVQQ